MISLAKTTKETKEFVLSCDPEVQEANTSEAIAEYLITGNSSELVIPDTATFITIKPLSWQERTVLTSKVLDRIPRDQLSRLKSGDAGGTEEVAYNEYIAWFDVVLVEARQGETKYSKAEFSAGLNGLDTNLVRHILQETHIHANRLARLSADQKKA